MNEEIVGVAELSAFQRDVLWLLADESSLKGVEVMRRLEEYYGDPVHQAQLYTNIDGLAEYGLIEKERAGGRSSVYSLTEAGRRSLSARQAWIGGAADD